MAEPIEVFTDGACKGNPGPGGWGALIVEGGDERELFGGETQTTNNRMELLAVIRALEAIDQDKALTVFTDSQYVQKGITEWITNWQRRGWKTASKQAVKNADLWKELVAVSMAAPSSGGGFADTTVTRVTSAPMNWPIVACPVPERSWP